MTPEFLRKLAAELAGGSFPGGCDHCAAEQELTEQFPGVFLLTVRHDDDCPELARHQRRSSGGGAA